MIHLTKKIFTIVLYMVVACIVALLLVIGEIPTFLNTRPVKYLLVEYLQDKLKAAITVGNVSLHIADGPGIAFNSVSIQVGSEFQLSTETVAMVFSPLQRWNGGDLLKRIRLLHPKIALSIDSITQTKSTSAFALPEIEIYDPEIRLRFKENTVSLKGGLTGYVRVKSDGTIAIDGELDFRDTEFKYNDDALKLRGIVLMKGQDMTTTGLDLMPGAVTVTAAGTYTASRQRTFHGKVHINGLQVGGGSGGPNPILEAILYKLNGVADFSISNMTLFGIPLDAVRAFGVARNGILYLNNLQAWGKSLSGAGIVTVDPVGDNGFDVNFKLQDYDIPTILATISKKPPWILGMMNLEGRVWGTNRSINGDLQFSSYNGRIMKFTILSKIFAVVNFYKLIIKRNPDLMSKGFAYNSILSHFSIRDSMISYNDFYLDSNSLQLSAAGTYSMRNDTIDALLGFRPLETIDRAINIIPVVSWILQGKDKGLFVIYLRMRGGIDDLRVLPAPMASISKGIGEMILRILMLPYTIFTKPQNLFPALPDKEK